MYQPAAIHLVWSCVYCSRIYYRYSGKYNGWLRHSKNINAYSKSAVDVHTVAGSMYQPAAIHLVWSCVYCSGFYYRYSGKHNGRMRYSKNINAYGKSITPVS